MLSQDASRIRPAGESWVAFPGGELEGRAPRIMCPACRAKASRQGTLCFQCYRSELDRERRLKAAASLDTASEARFQTTLPFEPVDRPRLDRLQAERRMARVEAAQVPVNQFELRLRQAQIAARKLVQKIVSSAPERYMATMHAAELQLPESWLPFVASR